MEEVALAAKAVALAAPYLGKVAKAAADAVGASAGKKLASWIKSKLTSLGEPEAIERAAKAPDDPSAHKLLEAMLDVKLGDDPALAEELAGLLKDAKDAGLTVQTSIQIGKENQSAQIVGNDNRVDFFRR